MVMDESAQAFGDAINALCSGWGISLTLLQSDLMWRHFQLLVDANRRLNLTRITDPLLAAVLHYADSLTVIAALEQHQISVRSVLDVGTGGGFPAIPLAIAKPDWSITAIDGTGKKIRCVQQFIETLQLTNVAAIQHRAEHWNSPPKFDLIVFRAVDSLGKNLERAHPFCHDATVVANYKTDPLDPPELLEASRSAAHWGYSQLEPWRYSLSHSNDTFVRQICLYRKTKNHGVR